MGPLPYTVLRVVEAGVVLFDFHRARLADGDGLELAFDAFAARARPGIYVLRGVGPAEFSVTERPASRLADGQPTRTLVSPIAHLAGPQRKVPSPSPWDAVRQEGVATLLVSAAGDEYLESCVASVLAWDGTRLLAPPDDRPRVASAFERWLVESAGAVRAPLRVDARQPLILANAVAGPCVPAQPVQPPPALVERLREAWLGTARRAAGRAE